MNYGGSNIIQKTKISIPAAQKPLSTTVDLPHFFDR